ncbi:2-oxo acid dehydrogenase subunit E2 [Rhodococcus sp. MS16]|uniref:dihydrolipoamide acetyltransferase family protein n=1 Tax=unclassified Rhodococcus (in: high G+C Gram-positive bacteria) TaxID=192944 RepID=UPI0011F69B14|nr:MULTISPECIES: dihydrolipoamide acetyltransferase family protein [unclassified Rhodococcus (in: high G+C Gram-positive bacteria)]NRI67751.1 2-oxo acid dehydrogenase subunit E2 [Rhodococcus sp. MS16]RZL22903.1 MAG: 2-oxo acid dehydrogenase subunit E2 [Rhodococcus sp. (in: high G+C Gram-positive bacteria)]
MTTAEFRLPDLGEGLTSAELVSWHVDVGEHVSIDQVIADVETAKAQVELPSPYAGVVTELLAEPGEAVPVGAPIIRIESTDPAGASTSAPPVLVGYGPATAHASRRRKRVPPAPAQHREMARAMTGSARAPQATVFVTIDVTASMELLDTLRTSADFENCSVTPLTLAAKSLVTAIASHPSVNATWDEAAERSVVHPRINLGIAVASDRGLLVPNIKDAGSLTLREIARLITELTSTARAGRTDVEHLTGGTVTITNVGVFGVDGGVALLNPGEAAILALGSVNERPWVRGGQIVIRQVATLSLTFDHRALDGQQASQFLTLVASMLADPAVLLAHL